MVNDYQANILDSAFYILVVSHLQEIGNKTKLVFAFIRGDFARSH